MRKEKWILSGTELGKPRSDPVSSEHGAFSIAQSS